MYCPKCGKQVPDNAAFCSECGANLKGESSKSAVHNGWAICIALSLLALLRAGYLYTTAFFPYDYKPPYSAHEIEVFLFFGLGLVGLFTGFFGLYHENKSASNPHRSTQEDVPPPKPGTKLTAQKLAIEGRPEWAKCSRCKTVQGSDRTVCQSCGAKFINRKPR